MIDYNEHLGDLSQFVEDNTKLVHHVAKRYKTAAQALPGVDYEDLVSVGTLGLMKAYEKFDPVAFMGQDNKGVKFSTYGVPKIMGEIQRFLRDFNPGLKFSRATKDTYNLLYKLDLLDDSPEDICEKLGLDIEDVKEAIYFADNRQPSHTDTVVYENDGDPITLGQMIPVHVDFESDLQWKEFLSTLSVKERTLLELREMEVTQSEIGKKIGVSQVQVSRILKHLKSKVKKHYDFSTVAV